MPSGVFNSLVKACVIRRDISYPPRQASEGEHYLLTTNDTRGWVGVDKHDGEPKPYYGMCILLQFDLSSIPAGSTITKAELHTFYQYVRGSRSHAVFFHQGLYSDYLWTPPPGEEDYGLQLIPGSRHPVASFSPGDDGMTNIWKAYTFELPNPRLSPGSVFTATLGFDFTRAPGNLADDAAAHCYVRVGFTEQHPQLGGASPFLYLEWEEPVPDTTAFGEVHGVLEIAASGGRTVYASALGQTHGVLEVTAGAQTTQQAAPGQVHGVLEVQASRTVTSNARGEVHGVLEVQASRTITSNAQGQVRGVLEVDAFDTVSLNVAVGQAHGVLELSVDFLITQLLALGQVHGVLELSAELEGGGWSALGQVHGVLEVRPSDGGGGGGGDATLSDTLPFSVSGNAVVTVNRNPVMMLPYAIGGTLGISQPHMDVGVALGMVVFGGEGGITAEIGARGEAEVVATCVVAGRVHGVDFGA